MLSTLVTWTSIKVLPKRDLAQCHFVLYCYKRPLSSDSVSVGVCISALAVCLFSSLSAELRSLVVASHVACRLVFIAVTGNGTDSISSLYR